MTRAELAGYFDHALLKADATPAQFQHLCKEADQHGFAIVAINSAPVAMCRELLAHSSVGVGAAIGFPLGQTTCDVKAFETIKAIEEGADEIDYVANLTNVKARDWKAVQHEMEQLTQICHERDILLKVIFETCYLEPQEIEDLAKIARTVGIDYVKTSTGFGTAGATLDNIKRMKQVVGDDVGVKAAGGIHTWELCKQMIDAGATRIGTISSVKILEEFSAAQ